MDRSGGTEYMGFPLFYAGTEHIDLRSGSLSLTGEESRHLARALRVSVGEIVEIGDGHGNRYRTRVRKVTAESVEMYIESSEFLDREIPGISVLQAVSRPSHMDRAVAGIAEAGARQLVPFTAPRSRNTDISKIAGRLERWRSIARESSKLARRVWPMEVGEPVGWPPVYGSGCVNGVKVILWEDEEEAGISGVLAEEKPSSVSILVGPEGGFSKGDIEELRSTGAVTVSLGGLNIRSETAGSYAVMLIRYRYGLLKPAGRETR